MSCAIWASLAPHIAQARPRFSAVNGLHSDVSTVRPHVSSMPKKTYSLRPFLPVDQLVAIPADRLQVLDPVRSPMRPVLAVMDL